MKLKLNELKSIVTKLVSEHLIAPERAWASQPDKRNHVVELDMGDEQGVAEVQIRNNVWSASPEPSNGYGGDWEAEVAGATVYDEEGEPIWVRGDDFLAMLSPEQSAELEAQVEEKILSQHVEFDD